MLDHEAAILQTLSSPADNSHRGQKHVLQLLDHFQIHGPNGIHDVLVTDVLVPMQYFDDFGMLDLKRTSYQTLIALTYLSERGVIHGGVSCQSCHGDTLLTSSEDLHADNLMFFFLD